MPLNEIGAETGHKRPHIGQRGKISREAPREQAGENAWLTGREKSPWLNTTQTENAALQECTRAAQIRAGTSEREGPQKKGKAKAFYSLA